MECVSFRAYEKGMLQGFADLNIPKWGAEMKGCKLFMKNGKRWVTPPSKEFENEKGEKKYALCLKFLTKELADAFSHQAIEAIDHFCKNKHNSEKGTQL